MAATAARGPPYCLAATIVAAAKSAWWPPDLLDGLHKGGGHDLLRLPPTDLIFVAFLLLFYFLKILPSFFLFKNTS